jgi:hypothetical protein
MAWLAFAGVVLVTTAAHGDDRGTATAILDELAKDTTHKDALAPIVLRGRDALERATRMRQAGDEAHARLADGLAREEAETGRDLVRALEAERTADDARRAATDAGTMGERERALLEDGIARNGRLRSEIDAIGKGSAAKGRPSASSDAGAPKTAGLRATTNDAGTR